MGMAPTVETAFLTQQYSDTFTFRPQSQLSQEKIHTPFHNFEEIRKTQLGNCCRWSERRTNWLTRLAAAMDIS